MRVVRMAAGRTVRGRSLRRGRVQAVAAAVDAGVLAGDPEQLAHRFWAAGHGRISLEINGFLPVDDTEYEQLCRRVIDGHRTP